AVSFSRIRFIRLPAAASRPELIICMPYRNSARPSRSPRTMLTSTIFPPFVRRPRRFHLFPASVPARAALRLYLIFTHSFLTHLVYPISKESVNGLYENFTNTFPPSDNLRRMPRRFARPKSH